MYVGWLFDSNQIEVTVIADCEFKTASNTITLSSSTASRTKSLKIIGDLNCRNNHKGRKPSPNK